MKEKIIKSIKRVIIDIIIIFGIGMLIAFLITPAPTSIYSNQIQAARDTTVIKDQFKIKENLSIQKIYNFSNYNEYKKLYKSSGTPRNCYYLSATEDKKDYILVQPLESKKYKKKMGGDFILQMSNPNYLITSDRWEEIIRVISNPCDLVYQELNKDNDKNIEKK